MLGRHATTLKRRCHCFAARGHRCVAPGERCVVADGRREDASPSRRGQRPRHRSLSCEEVDEGHGGSTPRGRHGPTATNNQTATPKSHPGSFWKEPTLQIPSPSFEECGRDCKIVTPARAQSTVARDVAQHLHGPSWPAEPAPRRGSGPSTGVLMNKRDAVSTGKQTQH